MAFFKFRKGGDEQTAPAPAAESVEAMRTRARHRLIGASVLVILGVIGFPLLFDSQPRPISVDIPIEIPDKNTIKPLTTARPSTPASQVIVETEAGTKAVEPASAPVAPVAKAVVKPESKPADKAPEKAVEKVAEKPADKPVEKPAEKPVDKALPRSNDGAKAQALLEGKTVESAASAPVAGRFVVQIGAYAEAAKAQEARAKLEKAGLKTYTQVVQPKEGKRIRVRVGPFETKAAADKVAEKIKKLDLPASILEL
ncbi:MAG TPA: SPOR domain-containing protein [Rhodoferax sp.]|jgi:DedD protein|nr:SPOR domain-containing protein [Rhodoferax sp.]HNV59451.1 SPOR domain-containing protein [Rhodoferax sp.]